jgi:hypothetical protein
MSEEPPVGGKLNLAAEIALGTELRGTLRIGWTGCARGMEPKPPEKLRPPPGEPCAPRASTQGEKTNNSPARTTALASTLRIGTLYQNFGIKVFFWRHINISNQCGYTRDFAPYGEFTKPVRSLQDLRLAPPSAARSEALWHFVVAQGGYCPVGIDAEAPCEATDPVSKEPDGVIPAPAEAPPPTASE